MDVKALEKAIARVLKTHRGTLFYLASRQSHLLELGATVGVMMHYRAVGFTVKVQNPRGRASFRVKISTRGHPCDYSRVICSREREVVEIHSNLLVRGAHGSGVYCVDVGVVREGVVPSQKTSTRFEPLPNEDLKTFAEAKKLVVYPMLLAQFIGIVHEITPSFLRRKDPLFGERGHLPPSLVALGNLSGTSAEIIDGFNRRGFQLKIASDYDIRLARVRKDSSQSPFFLGDEAASSAVPRAGVL